MAVDNRDGGLGAEVKAQRRAVLAHAKVADGVFEQVHRVWRFFRAGGCGLCFVAALHAADVAAGTESATGAGERDAADRAVALTLGDVVGEEGDEVWQLLLLMARSEEAADQAVRSQEMAALAKHAFAVAQAFHAYYQKPAYSVVYADSDDRRAFRTLVVDCFLKQMQTLTELLGIPVPERM